MKYFLLLLILFHTMMSAGLVTANDKIAMITDGPMLLLDVNEVITNINTEQLAALNASTMFRAMEFE